MIQDGCFVAGRVEFVKGDPDAPRSIAEGSGRRCRVVRRPGPLSAVVPRSPLPVVVLEAREGFAGGIAVLLEVLGDGSGEPGFARRVALPGVLPVRDHEGGVLGGVVVLVVVGQALLPAFLLSTPVRPGTS